MKNKDLKEKKEGLNEIIKDARTLVVMTDRGALFDGKEEDIVYTIAECVNKLYKSNKINSRVLKSMIQASVADDKELDDLILKELKTFKETLNNFSEKMNKIKEDIEEDKENE